MASDSGQPTQGAVRYSRVLDLRRAFTLGASVSVGLGIFVLMGEFEKLALFGTVSWSYVLLFVVALPILLTYAERASVIPGIGGPYNLARATGNFYTTFFAGWIQLGGYGALFALLGWGLALLLNTFLNVLFGVSFDLGPMAAVLIGVVGLNSLLGARVNWRTATSLIGIAIGFLVLLILRALINENSASASLPSSVSGSLELLTLTTLMMCGLWGMDYILSSRDEIRRPTRTIPPSLLATVLIVSVLGSVGAWAAGAYSSQGPYPVFPLLVSTDHSFIPESLLVIAYTVLGFGLLLLALNRGFVKSLRLFDAMTRDGFVPDRVQELAIGRTAFLQIAVPTIIAVVLVLLVPPLNIAGLASVAFLWVAALVHLPDAFQSKSTLPPNRWLKLPFHPLFPWITVALSLIMPFNLPSEVLSGVSLWVIAGVVYFVLYGRQGGAEVRRRTMVVETADAQDIKPSGYSVMVGIANPKTAAELIRVGARLAAMHDGTLLVLKTLIIPEQTPDHLKQKNAQADWEQLTRDVEAAGVGDVPYKAIVRLTPSIAEGILEAVREEKADLLLLGWEATALPDDVDSDPILSPVMRYAECDVALVKGRFPQHIKRAIVPTAGGPNAPLALAVGQKLVSDDEGEVTLVHVVTEALTEETRDSAEVYLEETLDAAGRPEGVEKRIVESESISDGIVAEAERADLFLIGSSLEGFLARPYYGGLATLAAFATKTPTLLTRVYKIPKHATLERVWSILTDPLPNLSIIRRKVVEKEMYFAAAANVDFYVLIILAAIIASLGLLQNSAAVVIGAMLVAPLMSPILSLAMSMVIGDYSQLLVALESTLKGATLAIIMGAVVVIVSPIETATSEILARTQPNVLDLGVALASGAAAGYAISRKEVSSALPGVAVSAALVPPLCVVGYGLGTSQLGVASGSLLLFVTNLIAIVFAAALIFLALGFHPGRSAEAGLQKGMQITIVSLAAILIVLTFTTAISVRQISLRKKLEAVFNQSYIANVGRVQDMKVSRQGSVWNIAATIIDYVGENLTHDEVKQLEEDLQEAVGGPVVMDTETIEAVKLRTGLEGMDVDRLLEERFSEEIESGGGVVVFVSAQAFRDGYSIDAAVIFEDANADADSVLAEIQTALSEEVGVNVVLQVTVIQGRQTQIGLETQETPVAVPTAEPGGPPTEESPPALTE